MSDSLIRTQLETSLQSSFKSLLKEHAEVVMLLIDTSGSMLAPLVTGEKRIDGLRKVVANIKQAGQCPMIAFGGPYDAQVRFVDDVPDPTGGTPLHVAIPYAKEYGATRLVVISDGLPDLTEQSLTVAREFGGRIDVVFVGIAGESGSTFLDELARITGGKRLEGDLAETKQLSSTVIGLLEGDVEPERAPIQGPGFTAEEAAPVEEDEDDDDEDDDDEDDDDEEDGDDD